MNPSSNRREEWDAWAPDYGRDVDWLEEILDPDLRELLAPAGKRVLDAGCGTGRRAASVLGDASAVLAVDFSEGMAAVARDVFSAMGGAEVLLLDMEKEPLPPGRPFDAAMDGTQEIGLAVLATTLSIVAVFLPIGFMGGIVGKFFHEFGLTIVAAVLISMFVSFTLDPAHCLLVAI